MQVFVEFKLLLVKQFSFLYSYIAFDRKQNSKIPHFLSTSKATQYIES
jgi:hypothetical protein